MPKIYREDMAERILKATITPPEQIGARVEELARVPQLAAFAPDNPAEKFKWSSADIQPFVLCLFCHSLMSEAPINLHSLKEILTSIPPIRMLKCVCNLADYAVHQTALFQSPDSQGCTLYFPKLSTHTFLDFFLRVFFFYS
eukprot:m.215044 g.215044  ORF g.215044 m.215044 type:complete len:142 (+) comp54069_c0_seq6:2285-2710(+)